MSKFKTFFVLVLCLVGLTNLSQSQTTYKLVFYNCDQDMDGSINNGIDTSFVKIYDSDSNKKISYKRELYPGEFSFFTNSKKVRIQIENIFNQKVDTILNLTKKKSNYKICEERFVNYESITTIGESIKNKQKWRLDFSSTGCFHFVKESLILDFQSGIPRITVWRNKTKGESSILDRSKIKKLILFEKKLQLMNRPMGLCTTEDSYTITSMSNSYTIDDKSCLWNGYFELKKGLGFTFN